MIKKHLIACSGMLVIMVSAKFFIYSTPSNRVNQFPQKVDFPSQEEETEEPSPASTAGVLDFANEGLPLRDRRVAWRMNKYLKAHNFRNLQTNELHRKAEKWFPLIEPILKAHGIPEDFKYIPLVESGFGSGTSHRGAAGYWQFMPGTARHYGLKVNGPTDERHNMNKSTVAACKYLNELFSEFGSWTLVAAAYNAGENSLKRQMVRQKKRNYFKMNLSRETASYVYKLISMKEIIENPLKYGYARRGKQLLAKKQDPEPVQAPFANWGNEQAAFNAMPVFSN